MVMVFIVTQIKMYIRVNGKMDVDVGKEYIDLIQDKYIEVCLKTINLKILIQLSMKLISIHIKVHFNQVFLSKENLITSRFLFKAN